MKRALACGVGWLLVWHTSTSIAQSPAPVSDYVRLGRPVAAAPAATLGRPVSASAPLPSTVPPVQSVAHREPAATSAGAIFRMQIQDVDSPSPFRPPEDDDPAPTRRSYRDDAEESYLSGRPTRKPSYRPSSSRYHHSVKFGKFFDGMGLKGDYFGYRGDNWFESDHCREFENFISPITNPFLFEDPRSLTEVRPIFFIQSIPNSNATFLGGHAEYFGVQLRLAVTDRISFVMNKLGGVSITPGDGSSQPGGSGFGELHLGPKYTFLRNADKRMLGAAGLTFQIPTGATSVYQDTGDLSLVPYLTFGKNCFQSRFGSLNIMDTFGYSFATDKERTDYFFNSLHLSWDVMDRHCFYPLLELNWFNYTHSGTVRPVGTEGRDLANLGSTGIAGKNNVHMAVGARYKFSERWQLGAAFEFPLINRTDMLEYRLTTDLIWRY